MALTKLTDVVVPQTFQKVVESKLTENSKIRQSGIAVTDPRFAISAGFETTVPFWRHPTGGEADSQSGDETVIGTSSKITQGKMTARVLSRAKAFSSMNIAGYASDSDAIAYAAGEFGRLRVADEESTVLAILKGLTAANVANRLTTDNTNGASNDMIVSKTRTTGTIGADNKMGKDVILAGRASMGDRGSDLKAIIMHSDLVNSLRSQEPNAFVPVSLTNITLEKYLGYFVIETDNVGIDTTNASYPVYTSYMLGDGLFAYASGVQDHPLEDVRNAAAGGWSGVDTIVNRFRYMLHAYGYQASGVPVNGISLTNAELAVGTNWARAVERKAVPLTVLKTNG